jgi:hypothetical protein
MPEVSQLRFRILRSLLYLLFELIPKLTNFVSLWVATRGRDLGGARFRIPGNEVAPGLTPTVGDLVIKAVTCADEGFYTCIPCNNWGNISGKA